MLVRTVQRKANLSDSVEPVEPAEHAVFEMDPICSFRPYVPVALEIGRDFTMPNLPRSLAPGRTSKQVVNVFTSVPWHVLVHSFRMFH